MLEERDYGDVLAKPIATFCMKCLMVSSILEAWKYARTILFNLTSAKGVSKK